MKLRRGTALAAVLISALGLSACVYYPPPATYAYVPCDTGAAPPPPGSQPPPPNAPPPAGEQAAPATGAPGGQCLAPVAGYPYPPAYGYPYYPYAYPYPAYPYYPPVAVGLGFGFRGHWR